MTDADATRTAPTPDDTVAVPTAPAAMGLPVPGYELLGVLGRGGMGVVYKANQVAVNRVVALKMLPGGAAAGPTAEARFQIEAEAVAALQHPGIVQVFEFGQAEGGRFLALEFVPGGTLADRMGKTPFTPRGAAELVAALADAVHAAHAKGVLHRDLKPANVLLTEAAEPKITDFGLARIGQSELTVSGAIMGTPSYMSPEQATGDGQKVGTPADVWALGAILYELLVGRPPFRRENVTATLHAVVHDTPEPPRLLNSRVSRDLETICLKCLQKDPADRYRTADALAADLRAYLGGFPVAARPVGFLRRTWKLVKRNPVRSAILGAVLAAGVGVGAFLPRYQTAAVTANPPTPAGVWVKADPDGEEWFGTLGQNVVAFTYSGGAVDFWVELDMPGQPMRRFQASLYEDHEGASDPNEVISGRWAWLREKPDKEGVEWWRVGLKRRWMPPTTTEGGTVTNAFGGGGTTMSRSGARGSSSSYGQTVAIGKGKGDAWDRGFGVVANPIAEDKPVCLKTVEGGWGRDEQGVAYTIRVMCEVVTPELAEQRKVEKETLRKNEPPREKLKFEKE